MENQAGVETETTGGAYAPVPTHAEVEKDKQDLIGILSSPPTRGSAEQQLPGDERIKVPKLHSDGPMVGAGVVVVLLLLAGFGVLVWFALFRNPF